MMAATTFRKIFAMTWLLVSVGCNQDPDRILYTGADFVFLDSKPQLPIYENQSAPVEIPVKINLTQAENVDVTFEVIGENVLEGSDYIVSTTSPIRIQRNKYTSSIFIQMVNNGIIQPEKRLVTVRIKSVNLSSLTIQVLREVVIELLDDDCDPSVPKVALWTGNLNIQGGSGAIDPGTGEGGPGGICGGSLVVNGHFFGTVNPSIRLTILMTQNVTFPTKGTASVIRSYLFEGSTRYEYEASGTYDETVKNITLNYSVYDTNILDFTGTHIITPK